MENLSFGMQKTHKIEWVGDPQRAFSEKQDSSSQPKTAHLTPGNSENPAFGDRL